MTDAPHTSSRTPRAALAAIAIGLGGLAVATVTSDRDFAIKLDRAVAGSATSQARVAGVGVPPVVGTEAFWLANRSAVQSTALEPAAFVSRFMRGDRYEFGGAGGKRILEVVEVRELTGSAATGGSGLQLLVSFRDVAEDAAAPVRMLVEAGSPLAGLTPVSRHHDRTL